MLRRIMIVTALAACLASLSFGAQAATYSFTDRPAADGMVDEGNPDLVGTPNEGKWYITFSGTDYDTGGSGWTLCPVLQWNLDLSTGETISSVSTATWRCIFANWSWGTSEDQTFRVYRLTAAFPESGMTWNNRPARDPSAYVDVTLNLNSYAAVDIDISPLLAKNGNLSTFGIEVSGFNNPGTSGGYFFCYSVNGPGYEGWGKGNLAATYETNVIPGSISGTINLLDYVGDLDVAPVRVEFREPNTTTALSSALVTLGSDGSYSISDVAPGTYDIAFTGCKWLKKVMNGITVAALQNTVVDADLSNGDVDGDNEITSTDLSILGLGLGLTGD